MARSEEIKPLLWQTPHEVRLRVRYAETDQMGVVYYAHYAVYCEVARTEWLRRLGLTYAEMEAEMGVMLPVRRFSITYHRPARYDDELRIESWLSEPPATRLHFQHRIYRSEELLAEAEVLLIFVDKKTWRPCRPPQAFYEALAEANLR
ncbi:MAG: acyl-CoA thioesterase [Bacteroidia bacterium]|nr:acyl-CoA thioesterase [Bacteroidia bacterium]MCX7651447.1 acyl-CoA thioesterase [Bacteroidia bacterium]MDW8416798.1 thioesterase family protein [Bacteroidia bacterium]